MVNTFMSENDKKAWAAEQEWLESCREEIQEKEHEQELLESYARMRQVIDALFDCLVDSVGTKAAVEELATNYLPDMDDEEIQYLLRDKGTKYLIKHKVNQSGQPYVELQSIES